MATMKKTLASAAAAVLAFAALPAAAQQGTVLTTPVTPMELPIEVEIELSPAGSLKQAPLWKELIQLLRNPYDPVVRRPGFGVDMPPLDVYPVDYNFLTGQPLRLRTSDGEVSWDQPGPLFDPEEVVSTDAFNTPIQLRTVIGHVVACPDAPPGYQAAVLPATFCDGQPEGSLVVFNPDAHPAIPPDGTVIAVASFFDGPCTRSIRRPASSRTSSSSTSRSTRRISSGTRPTSRRFPPRCSRTSAGSGRRSWARPCSGTCRWAAMASRPAARAISTAAWTTGRGTSSTRTR
jgi:hypothetical protein